MSSDARKTARDFPCCLAENFIFGGTSALLLAIVHLHPGVWYISLFALIPFLWRAVRTSLFCSVLLGSLFATCYTLVTVPTAAWFVPSGLLLRLSLLNALFVLYAVSVNRTAKRIGFNAVLLATLWLPVEYMMSEWAHLGSILVIAETDSTLVFRIGSLFGIVAASAAVILVNSLLLAVLDRVIKIRLPRSLRTTQINPTLVNLNQPTVPRNDKDDLHDPRGPPTPLQRQSGSSRRRSDLQVITIESET